MGAAGDMGTRPPLLIPTSPFCLSAITLLKKYLRLISAAKSRWRPSVPLCILTPLLSPGHGKLRVFSGEVSGEQLSPIILSTSLSFPDYILHQQFVCGKNQSCQGSSQDRHGVQGAPSGGRGP